MGAEGGENLARRHSGLPTIEKMFTKLFGNSVVTSSAEVLQRGYCLGSLK